MIRGRLALLALGPALVLIAGQLVAYHVAARPANSSRARLESRAVAVATRLDALLSEAKAAALRARDGAPASAGEDLAAWLFDRLEGAGVLRGGRFEAWTGTPAEAALTM